MRFYDIRISDPNTGALVQRFTNKLPNGRPDMGAPDVEMDIAVGIQATPMQNSAFVRIWGIPLKTISHSLDLNGMTISVYGGMQKGLPLANPAQAGLLVDGTITPVYGNWQGTAMTLDIQITKYLYAALSEAVNIVLNWPAGMPLQVALANSLGVAFPAATSEITISPMLVQNYPEQHYAENLDQLSQYLKQKTQAMLGGDYPGIDIVMIGALITVSDGTIPPAAAKQINFQDLLGQPTWQDFNHIQVQTVMRGDIRPMDFVTLPPTITSITGSAVAPPLAGNLSRANSVFQGTFRVIYARHIGRARQPDAASWCSIFTLQLPPDASLPENVGPPIEAPIPEGTVTIGTITQVSAG